MAKKRPFTAPRKWPHAVIISTLTTLVVLLPVLFVPGIAGFLFQDLALTVSFALIMSTLAALSIIPPAQRPVFLQGR